MEKCKKPSCRSVSLHARQRMILQEKTYNEIFSSGGKRMRCTERLMWNHRLPRSRLSASRVLNLDKFLGLTGSLLRVVLVEIGKEFLSVSNYVSFRQ